MTTDINHRLLVLRKRSVCELLGISSSTWDRLRATGDAPAPIKLGVQAIGWTRDAIEAFIASRETKTVG